MSCCIPQMKRELAHELLYSTEKKEADTRAAVSYRGSKDWHTSCCIPQKEKAGTRAVVFHRKRKLAHELLYSQTRRKLAHQALYSTKEEEAVTRAAISHRIIARGIGRKGPSLLPTGTQRGCCCHRLSLCCCHQGRTRCRDEGVAAGP